VPPTRVPEAVRDQAVKTLARWAVREAYDQVAELSGKLPTIHAVGDWMFEDPRDGWFYHLTNMLQEAVTAVLEAGVKK
jgi:hypothetical protein